MRLQQRVACQIRFLKLQKTEMSHLISSTSKHVVLGKFTIQRKGDRNNFTKAEDTLCVKNLLV